MQAADKGVRRLSVSQVEIAYDLLADVGKAAGKFRLFFFQAEDGIRDLTVTGVQTCALPISSGRKGAGAKPHAGRAGVGKPPGVSAAKAAVKPAAKTAKGGAKPAAAAPPPPAKVKFRGRVLENEPLGRYTTYRLGGPARFFVMPADPDDVAKALDLAQDRGLPWLALGLGSNVLVKDAGFPGVVIRIGKGLDRFEMKGATAIVGAGLATPLLARRTAEAGFAAVG